MLLSIRNYLLRRKVIRINCKKSLRIHCSFWLIPLVIMHLLTGLGKSGRIFCKLNVKKGWIVFEIFLKLVVFRSIINTLRIQQFPLQIVVCVCFFGVKYDMVSWLWAQIQLDVWSWRHQQSTLVATTITTIKSFKQRQRSNIIWAWTHWFLWTLWRRWIQAIS